VARKKLWADISDVDIELAKTFINIEKADRDYYNSGRWKCPKSPSGAHFWFVEELGQKRNIRLNRQTCICCDETRKYCILE
jgi:hypothetical protein